MTGLEVAWVNAEHTILVVRAVDKWTWDDFYAAQRHIDQLLAGIDYPVDMIIESMLSTLPPNALSHFRRHSSDSNRNIRRIALIADHAFLRAMYQMYTTIVRKDNRRLMMVRSMDEALTMLRKVEV